MQVREDAGKSGALPERRPPRAASLNTRALVVDEGRRTGGLGEAMMAAVAEHASGTPMRRVAGADSYIPLGPAANLVLLRDNSGFVRESGRELRSLVGATELAQGDVLAALSTGAYTYSMASNYNGARRPAVIWLAGGAAHLVQERQSLTDLTARDRPLPGNQAPGSQLERR